MFDRRDLDRVFGALAHADRRRVLDLLKAEPGSTVGEVAAAFRTSRVAIMKHLAVLEEAGLVVSRREGRCRRLHLNPAPIRMIHDRWTTRFSALWARGLAELKYRLEERREPWRRSPSSSASTSARPRKPRGTRSRKPGSSSGPTSTRSSSGS